MSHHCQGSCSCMQQGTSCGQASAACQPGCHCPCHAMHHHMGKYSDELLALADEAWMEVLKEKIKEEIRQHSNEHLTQTAKLVAEANHLRWKEKLQSKKDLQDYEDRLRNLICSPQTNNPRK